MHFRESSILFIVGTDTTVFWEKISFIYFNVYESGQFSQAAFTLGRKTVKLGLL